MKDIILVSACLLGLKTRYDGSGAYSKEAIEELKGKITVPVCPEQLGGLSTPRPRASIERGTGCDILEGRSRVVDANGKDVTSPFIKGAQAVLDVARLTGAKEAFLKEKSPSCAVKRVYNGPSLVQGSGVTAALLEKNGIKTKGF